MRAKADGGEAGRSLDGRADLSPIGSWLGPTGRTLVLWVAAILSGSVIVLVALIGLVGVDTAAEDLESRALPAQMALQATSDHSARGQLQFEAAVAGQGQERAEALIAAQDEGRERDADWDAYHRVAFDGSEERALQRRFETLRVEANDLGATIFGLDADDPNRARLLAEERAAADQQVEILAAIELTVYRPAVRQELAAIRNGIRSERWSVMAASAVLAVVFSGIGLLVLRGARRAQAHIAEETVATRAAGERAAFEGSFQRGLELASTEDATYHIVERALSMIAPGVSSELLLADSSQAHFRQVLSTDGDEEAACRVGSPGDCPAAKSGQTRTFEDSTRLDACPFLRGNREPVWAVCAPVSVAGQSIGVAHAQRPLQHPRPPAIASGLELVSRRAGERIGAIRVLARTEVQAQVDPLTGLPNRRTLEEQVRDLPEDEYVVAFADLDHFKAINDGHGHETGDRALRLFARVLRDGVRPRDLIARFGGEEFVAVLPDCSLDDARVVAERIRADLATALANGAIPPFTVTIGLAEAVPGEALASMIALADAAMLSAKTQGRDRVVAHGDPTPRPGPGLAAVPSAG